VRSGSAAPYSAPNQAFRQPTAGSWSRPTRPIAGSGFANCSTCLGWHRRPLRDLAAAGGEPAEVVAALTEVFRSSTDAWLPALLQADILCSRVANYQDVMRHPRVWPIA
jgi:hypothetical protein